jgi:FMN phosphatase YigB (HAD superfamily)
MDTQGQEGDHLLDINLPDKRYKNKMLIFIITTIILALLCIIFIILYASEKNKNGSEPSQSEGDPLSLWNDCELKTKLVDFVQRVTNKDHKDFVKNEDRIAVFDFDGTLFQETDPVYTDYKLFKYRVLDDPDYKDKATEEQKSVAHEIEDVMRDSIFPEGLDLRHAKANAEVFQNMTIEETDAYTKAFLDQPAEGYNNLKRGDAFYKPMVEVVNYLKKNNFTVYIVSGSDRFTVRSAVDGKLDIPKNNIIGSEYVVIASHQGDINGFNYTFNTTNDILINSGKLVVKNLYMNKVHHIIREIGQTPLLSFGNSNGDSSMANYVMSNKNHEGLAFMLLSDDVERENGNKAKAEKFKAACDANGWISVSMEKDWKTIYGDGVTIKKKEIN